MSDLELCRICAKQQMYQMSNLFDGRHAKMLKQIEKLTGKALTNETNLPQDICQSCSEDLKKAFDFRVRLLTVQFYFTTQHYLDKLKLNQQKVYDESTNIPSDLATADENDYVISSTFELLEETVIEEHIEDFAYEENTVTTEAQQSSTEYNETAMEIAVTSLKRQRKKESRDMCTCDLCGKVLSSRRHLIVHYRRHSNFRPYQCDLCEKSFFAQHNMMRHKKTHNGERQHTCKYCGKRFFDANSMKKHAKRHIIARPYACTYCDLKFKHEPYLKKHLLYHTGESNFNCSVCNQFFPTKSIYDKHSRTQKHIRNVMAIQKASTI